MAHDDEDSLRRTACKLRQNNAITKKCFLPLTDLADLSDITRAVRSNTTVNEVSLFCEYIEDDWVTPDIWRLFGAVGDLPLLDSLKFDFIGSDGDELPILLLAEVVRGANHLTKLNLSCVKLTGSQEEFTRFSQALQGKPLATLHIYGCYMKEEERITWPFLLDESVTAMSRLENLKDVLITALEFDTLGKLSCEALGQLIRTSPKLERLVLGEFELNDEHVAAMAVAMEENNTLEEINFGCQLGTAGAEALAQMLRRNNILQILHIHTSGLDGGESNHIALAHALEANSAIKQFSLYGTTGKMTHNALKAYADMVKINYSLEELEFQDDEESLPEIVMYLQLNTEGRSQLLQSTTTSRDDWIRMIMQLQDNLDCVFYLLSLNPTVVESMATARISHVYSRDANKKQRLKK